MRQYICMEAAEPGSDVEPEPEPEPDLASCLVS